MTAEAGRGRRLFRFACFMGGNILQKASQFLLLPLLVASMTPAEFSRFGLFSSGVVLAVTIITANLHLSFGRIWFDYDALEGRVSALFTVSSVGLSLLAVGLSLAFLVWNVAGVVDPLTLGNPWMFVLAAAATFTLAATQVIPLLFRVIDRPVLFVVAIALLGFGQLAGYVVALRYAPDALSAALLAYLAAQLALIGLGVALGWQWYSIARFTPRAVHLGLDYSLGTTLHQIVNWATLQSGRWIGATCIGAASMAAYTLTTYVYLAMMIVVNMLFETMRVETLTRFARGDLSTAERGLDRLLLLAFCAVAVMLVALCGVVFWQDRVLPEAYRVPMSYLPPIVWIIIAQTFFVRNFWTAIGLKRTRALSLAELPPAFVGVPVAYGAVSYYGVEGLLYATAGIVTAQTAIGWWLKRRWCTADTNDTTNRTST